MKNQITNLNSMSALIANTPMTAVNTARMNECFAKTDSEESRTIIKAMASLDTFDSLYAVKRCEVLANARYTLATHKDFTFKDLCTAFEIDNSNGGAMADTWDKFYSHKDDIYNEFEIDIFQYSVNILKPFKNKDTSRVCKILKYAGYTLSVKNARAIASAMDISGYIDGLEVDKILNGDVTNSKSDSKSDSKTKVTDSKSVSNSDSKTKVNTAEIPVIKIGDTLIVIDEDGVKRQFSIARKKDGEIILQFVSGVDDNNSND